MADRFPIIVDTSGIAALKELPAGDNLNLLNSGVVNAGAVDLTTITVSGSQGTDGQVLTSTGSGIAWENASAGGISDIVSDTSPQLGGALDVNGQDIVSTSNGAIDLDPHGSGVVVFKGNATKGAGQFKLNCENNSHGVIIKGPAHAAAANYTLTLPTTDGNADQQLKTDGSGNLAWVDAAGGGRWTQISKTTLDPANPIQLIEFTNFVNSAYSEYELRWSGVGAKAAAYELVIYVQLGLTGYNSANYQTADYSVENWYNSGVSGLSNTTEPTRLSSRTQGSFKLSQVYGQWVSYPESFGRINFTAEGSMLSWECNMHSGGRATSPNDRSGLHRNWGLGYHWGSGGTAAIEKIKLYDGGNGFGKGTFTMYGLTVT